MLRRKVVSLSNLSLFESETIISRKIISERKICHCYGFMLWDFQIICGSMVNKNRWLPALNQTPALSNILIQITPRYTKHHTKIFLFTVLGMCHQIV